MIRNFDLVDRFRSLPLPVLATKPNPVLIQAAQTECAVERLLTSEWSFQAGIRKEFGDFAVRIRFPRIKSPMMIAGMCCG